ncbi:MAG: hypothetical protein LC803_16670 [Acidobacteria bacterium]|nr:hypothetical protein [Acidobacteriota bacterium]
MTTTPYIPDPNKPCCPSCRATIYVQAEGYEVDFNLAGGKTEKRTKYRVRNFLVETLPDVLTACHCAWLLATIVGQRTARQTAEAKV